MYSQGPESKHLVFLLAWFLALLPLAAQTPTGSLRGRVLDPSGAAVAGATVLVVPADRPAVTPTTNRDGALPGRAPAPGSHTVQVVAKGVDNLAAQAHVVA